MPIFLRRIGSGLLIMLAVCVAVLLAVGAYMLNYALRPERIKVRSTQAEYERLFHSYPHLKPWVDSLRAANALRDIRMTDFHGLSLHAIYVPAAIPTRQTAVIVHGYTDSAVYMLMIGHLYSHELGYNILLPDLHGHGESGGEDIQMGWKDRLDVMRWTEVADSLFGGDTRMVVHGLSMGAATTMMLAGDVNGEAHDYLTCFVEDCGYTDVWSEFKHELRQSFGLPTFPFLHTTNWLCQMRYGWNFHEASSLKQVARSRLPMLFIHGSEDTYVPTDMVYPLYAAKPEPKELWIVPGATHAQSYKLNAEEYTRRVSDFVSVYCH